MNNTAIALGTFDGLHSGHRKVLNHALTSSYKPIVFTFKEPPKFSFGKNDGLLISEYDKINRLYAMGFEEVECVDFCEVKNLLPSDFLYLLVEKYSPKLICCGFNYRFGKNGCGDVNLLETFCKENGIELFVAPCEKKNGEIISSTLLRKMLKEGKVEYYKEVCQYPFGFTAEVQHGDCRGRKIGFPTVNQFYPNDLAKVKPGVYISTVTFDKMQYKSITDIGIRPTFQTDYIAAETHILDFSDNIYGKPVTLSLNKFLREEIKFSGIEELKKQIEKDILTAKSIGI